MNIIIKWLNINQGFVMTLLTLVYVIATIIIVNEMKKVRYESERPYVVCSFLYDEYMNSFYIIIKNYGKNMAKVTSLQMSPNVKLFKNKINDVMNETMIAPNQALHFSVDENEIKSILEGEKSSKFDIDLKYMDVNTKKDYHEDSSTYLTYIKEITSKTRSKSKNNVAENALMNIEDALKSMAVNNYLS